MIVNAVRGLFATPTLTADEGGLRIERGRQRSYLPFAELESARLRRSLLGRHELAIVRTSGARANLSLGQATPSAILGSVLAGIEANGERARARVPKLARVGRDVRTWLAHVDAIAISGAVAPTYRTAPAARDELVALVRSTRGPIDVRAAAAHALLAHGEIEHVIAVARALRGAPPPLMLIAIGCAPGGAVFVSSALMEEALAFVSADDREAFVALRRSASENGVARAHEAKRAVLREEAALIAASHRAGRRTARPHGSSDLMISGMWVY